MEPEKRETRLKYEIIVLVLNPGERLEVLMIRGKGLA